MNETPTIAATATGGLIVTLPNGKQARLAIVDDSGAIIASDSDVARQAFDASCRAYRNFLQGTGHIRAVSNPAGIHVSAETAAA